MLNIKIGNLIGKETIIKNISLKLNKSYSHSKFQ